MENKPSVSRIKQLLANIKAKGAEAIDKGLELATEAGVNPDLAAAGAATASAAQDLFIPDDEVGLVSAMLPVGKISRLLVKGGKRPYEILHYESQADRLARKAKAAEDAPTLNYSLFKSKGEITRKPGKQ